MFDFIMFFAVIVSTTLLMSNLAKVKSINSKLMEEILQAYIDRNIVAEQLSLALLEKDKKSLEQSDEFLTFISQSRDWAFEYIEVTQKKVYNFIKNVGPTIEYLEEYAPPLILEDQRLRIVEGYKDIKSILPEDYGKLDT
jgi:disulfide oxidoreductase YuzD